MPVTFGSVGDIISVSLIVKDLVKALDDSRGSAAEYQEVIRELWMLDRVLLEVELLSRTCEHNVNLNALCVTARRIVDSCRQCVKTLLDKIERYRTSLGSQNGGNPIRDLAMKVRWNLSRSGELAKFRAEINAHCMSLDMLLITANVNLTCLNDTEAMNRHLISERSHQEAAEEQHSLLVDIRARVAENTRFVKSYAENVSSALRLDWLKSLGSELTNFMGRILITNLAIFRAVSDMKASLPSHLERALIHEPFLLEDAIGRISPIHMQFISSWEAFDSVLAIRFRDMQGHAKVLSKEYILQEHATRRDIARDRLWEATFLPGQRIDMSMVFQRAGEPSRASCPGCQQVCGESSADEMQCSGCGLLFKRVTEINHQEPDRNASEEAASSSFPTAAGSLGGSCGISKGQKKARVDAVSAENEVVHFKRVRLIYQYTPLQNESDFENSAVSVTEICAEDDFLEENPRPEHQISPPPQDQRQTLNAWLSDDVPGSPYSSGLIEASASTSSEDVPSFGLSGPHSDESRVLQWPGQRTPPWSRVLGAGAGHELAVERMYPPDRNYPDFIEAELDELEKEATDTHSHSGGSGKEEKQNDLLDKWVSDGNECDNEAGFATSDDDADVDAQFGFWTPGRKVRGCAIGEASTYRASAHRIPSPSSINWLRPPKKKRREKTARLPD